MVLLKFNESVPVEDVSNEEKMMSTFLLQELGIDKLSRDQRIELVQEIWESIASEQSSTPLLTDAQRAATHPRRFRKVLGETRQALAAKFPYCIYYQVLSDLVVVLAVFHSSRGPST